MNHFIRCSFFFLALPTVIFCIFWCNWWIALPLVLLIIKTCLSVSSGANLGGNVGFVLRRRDVFLLGIAFSLIVLSQYLVGYTGVFTQHGDFASRNAMYGTLCSEVWPVKAENGVPMVYYIGGWLPSALISKLAGFGCRNHLFMYQNVFILFAAYLLLCLRLRKVTLTPILAVAILGSVPEIFGTCFDRFFGACWVQDWYFSPAPLWPSPWKQLSCTVNHGAYSFLAGALCCMRYKNGVTYAFIGALLLVVSPISTIALSPLILYKLMPVCRDIKELVSGNICFMTTALVVMVMFVFFTQVSTQGARVNFLCAKMLHYGVADDVRILVSYIGTCGIILLLFVRGKMRDAEFWIVFISFALLPLCLYGYNYNEIMLKGPAPLWIFFCLYFAQVMGKKTQMIPRMTAAVLIGLFCLRGIKAVPRCVEQFRDYEHNICDPYGSDYFSAKATEAKRVTKGYRVFPMPDELSMKPEECRPILSYILK